MRCLWLEDRKVTFRTDVPDPRPAEGEALLRVRLAGVCSTDLELVRGYYPFAGVPGHELVADVLEAVGAPELVGARVVGEINAVCGTCPQCRANRRSHCEQRTVLGIVRRNGALAELTTLPIENLHRVPQWVPDEVAVFCEPLAAALEVTEQVAIRPTDRVLLLGAGRLGQLAARVLALSGCDLAVAVRSGGRPRELLDACGLRTIDVAQVGDRSADVVVEATGSPDGLAIARRAVRPAGTIVLKSTYRGTVDLDLSSLVVDEVTLVGSRCGPFEPALRLLERGLVDPRPLVEAKLPLSRGVEAFDVAARQGVLKVLVDPSG